jgi:hypothetical protein
MTYGGKQNDCVSKLLGVSGVDLGGPQTKVGEFGADQESVARNFVAIIHQRSFPLLSAPPYEFLVAFGSTRFRSQCLQLTSPPSFDLHTSSPLFTMAAAGDLRDIMDMPHEGPRKPAQKKARGAPQPRLCTLSSKGGTSNADRWKPA